MAAPVNKAQSERNTPIPERKPLIVQYNKQANKADMRSVTLENVQECFRGCGFKTFPNMINFKSLTAKASAYKMAR